MATLKGRGIVWGVGLTATLAGGWATSASGTIVASHEYSLEANQKELLGLTGDAVGLVFSNIRKVLTVEVIPAHATTIAGAQGNNILPTIGEYVTIVDSESTDVDASHSGKYIFVGGSKSATQDGEQRMTFNLIQYLANDLSTTIT